MIKAFLILIGLTFISNHFLPVKDVDDEDIKKVATSFHEWYLKHVGSGYASSVIKVDQSPEGMSQLNVASYINQLNNLGTISQIFIESEKQRIQSCSEHLSKIEWEEFQKAEGYEYEYKCGFFYHYYWFNSQEKPDKVKAVNVEEKEDHWIVCLNFLNVRNGEEHIGSSYQPKVKVEEIDGQLMITEIQ